MVSFLNAVQCEWIFTSIPFSFETYSFQTELPALLALGLENKQQPWYFLLNPPLHKLSFSVQVYFNLQQHGQSVNTFLPCLLVLLLLSCEERPLWVRQVRCAVETETGLLRSMLKKIFVNRGAARIFLTGGLKLWKQKPL